MILRRAESAKRAKPSVERAKQACAVTVAPVLGRNSGEAIRDLRGGGRVCSGIVRGIDQLLAGH